MIDFANKEVENALNELSLDLENNLEDILRKLDLDEYKICPKELVLYNQEKKDVGSFMPFYDELSQNNKKLLEFVNELKRLLLQIRKADSVGGFFTPDEDVTPPNVVITPTDEGKTIENGGFTPGEEETTENDESTPGEKETTENDESTPGEQFTSTNTTKTGKIILNNDDIVVVDENGNVIDVLKRGEYSVYDVKYDENGNVVAVRISGESEPEKWILLNQNGIEVGTFIADNQMGTYTFSDMDLNVYDANGNIIGTLNGGSYRVYDVKYDEMGQISMVRISPNGEDEVWIKVCDDNICYGTYTPNPTFVETVIDLPDGKSKVSLFSTKNIGIGAIIGILALGTYGVVKKVKKNNENQEDKDENDFVPGEYDIYDVKQAEDGNVKEALVKEKNSDDSYGYWLEF